MILIETYDVTGRTALHTQSCDGVPLRGRTLARLNEPPAMPIIDRFVTHISGGSIWHGKPAIDLTIPAGGSLLICHCTEEENGRVL